ncbi:hypothetical protein BGX29_001793, partial [Mortierella sp. GBA35]
VPWDDLRKVLKDKLESVLESKKLAYTTSRVTNPHTTTLTAVPNNNDNTALSEVSIVANTTEASTTAQEQESTTEPVLTTTNNKDDDQPHVPEQEQEQPQEQKDRNTGDDASTAENVDKPETSLPEPAVGQTEEAQATPAETPSPKDDGSEVEAKDKETRKKFNGPSTVEKEEGEHKEKEKGQEQEQEQEETQNEDSINVVPISTNTLVLETPQGYHNRINAMLDAFTSAPFTIQRVCELLSNPTEHHTNLIKYLRAVEKVLMITSSVNEFSNPAYNGPSALDEKEEDRHHHDVEGKRSAVVNGDYYRAKDLDFGLISTPMPISSDESSSDEEDFETVAAAVESEALLGTEVAEEEDEEALALEESEKTTTTAADAATATVIGATEDMDVEKAISTSDMDVDTAVAVASTMDGIETGDASEGGMDVDQV